MRPVVLGDILKGSLPYRTVQFVGQRVLVRGDSHPNRVYTGGEFCRVPSSFEIVRPSLVHLGFGSSSVLTSDPRVPKSVDLLDVQSTQLGFRKSPLAIKELEDDYLKRGCFEKPVSLMRLPDGKIFIRDGHHRIEVMKKYGPGILSNSAENQAFTCDVFTYQDLQTVIFAFDSQGDLDTHRSWLTPFDPRLQIRRADFFPVKELIKTLYKNGVPLDELSRFLYDNPGLYSFSRSETESGTPLIDIRPAEEKRDWKSYLARMDESMGPKISQLITVVPSKGVMIDVGTGTGLQSHAYSVLFPEVFVVGVDMAEQAIEHARGQFKNENLLFMQANATHPFAPIGSVDAVMDSSFVHELFSYNGYDREKISEYYQNVFQTLVAGGSYGSRDFTSPFWPSKVRIKLPTQKEDQQGEYGLLSRSELFEIYAKNLRTKDFPNGVSYEELESDDADWRLFELDGVAAANFILRMEYRKNWEAELEEQYLYFNLLERRDALEKAGFRVDFLGEVHNAWIYLNWWKKRLSVLDSNGTGLDLPPTNCLVYATKPGPHDPKRLQISSVREDDPLATIFNVQSYQHQFSHDAYDLVHVDRETEIRIPYTVDLDGLVYVAVQSRVERPALAYYSQNSRVHHNHYSGYTSVALSELTLDEGMQTEDMPAYFSSPGISNDLVLSKRIALSSRHPVFSQQGVRKIELKKLIASAHVGAIPDPVLEVAAYGIAKNLSLSLLPWFDGNLPLSDQKKHGVKIAGRYPLIDEFYQSDDDYFEERSVRGNFIKTIQLECQRDRFDGETDFFEEPLFVPRNYSLDTYSAIPYFKSEGRVFVGLEVRYLPAFETKGFTGRLNVVPAWRLPKSIESRGQATRFIKDSFKKDFNLHSLNVTPLGEGYFPAAHRTPEKISPLAVEVDTSELPKDLVFVSLEALLKDLDSIPDLHTKISVYRLAHALHFLNEG